MKPDELAMTLRLEAANIPWREPTEITVPTVGSGLGCRLCIAMYGVKGSDVNELPQDEDEFAAHMRDAHGVRS